MYCIEIGVTAPIQIGLKETGPQGIKGDTGDQGIQGEKGDTGDQGIQGEKGDTGDQGPSGDNTKYAAEVVAAPTSGTLTLKLATEIYIGTLTNANTFTVALPVPVAGSVNESILIFKTGATLPTLTMPGGINWQWSIPPVLAVNAFYCLMFENLCTAGSTYEIRGRVI